MSQDIPLKQWEQIVTRNHSLVIQKEIGKGMFGTVYSAVSQVDNLIFAVKQVFKSKINSDYLKQALKQEMEIQQKINNPNVVKLFDVIDQQLTNSYLLIMEYCAKGDLQKELMEKGPINERLGMVNLKMILNGLVSIHQQNVVHRDLKLANIYQHQGTLKIGDFGLAKQCQEGQLLKSCVGNLSNMAPEIFYGQPYSSKADIYSVGILLYQMLFGDIPFKPADMNPNSLYKLAQEGNINFKLNGISISSPTQDLIKQMLQYNSDHRISMPQILQHQSFKRINTFPSEVIGAQDLALQEIAHNNIKVSYYEVEQKNQYQNENKQPVNNYNAQKTYPTFPQLSSQNSISNIIPQNILNQQKAVANQPVQIQPVDKKKEGLRFDMINQIEKDHDLGLLKYIHRRNVIGLMIQLLNDAPKYANLKPIVNYQIPVFLTTKKIIQQIKNLLQDLKNKNNIFQIPSFPDFTQKIQYKNLIAKVEEDLELMRKSYPALLQECKDNIKKINFYHPQVLKELESENSEPKFDDTYKGSLVNYYYSLQSAFYDQVKEVQQNLLFHLILLSEIAAIKTLNEKFGFDFEQHKQELKKIPPNQYQRELEAAGERMFS